MKTNIGAENPAIGKRGAKSLNSLELLYDVRRLKRAKEKNEAALTAEDLNGKYAKAYARLCKNLEERQCELRSAYVKAVRILGGMLAESVYVPAAEEDEWLHDRSLKAAKESGDDPLVKELLKIFWMFGEDEK